MRDEAVISDGNELTNKCVGLNSAPLADLYSLLYLNKWPNKSFISKYASIEVDRLNDSDVFPKRYIDNPSLPNFRVCHKGVA